MLGSGVHIGQVCKYGSDYFRNRPLHENVLNINEIFWGVFLADLARDAWEGVRIEPDSGEASRAVLTQLIQV